MSIYCLLSVGLSFATASWGLKILIRTDTDYANPETKRRWMLRWDLDLRKLVLETFDMEEAIALLDKGQAVIPIWLETIHQKLEKKLI